jgi:hypothetical protein
MASSMTISRLKKSSYGYYKYASKNIWLSDDMFESNDIRNIGFIIRKVINRVDREIFKKELSAKLTEFACSANDEQIGLSMPGHTSPSPPASLISKFVYQKYLGRQLCW